MEPRVLQCVAAFVVAVVIGAYAASRRERICWPVVSLMAAIAVWTLSLGFRFVATGPDDAALLAGFYLSGAAIPPLWTLLSVRLTRADWLSNRTALALAIPSAAGFIAAVSNPVHHLYFRTGAPDLRGNIPADAGPLFWASTAWSYLLVAIGIGVFIRSAWVISRNGNPWRGVSIAAVSILPLAAGLTSTLGLLSPGHYLTPLAIAIAVGSLFGLHWRFQMRETLPVARRDVIEHLGDGVIILDDAGRILDVNPAAAEIVGLDPKDLHRRMLRDAWVSWDVEPSDLELPRDPSSAVSQPWVRSFETTGGRFIEATMARIGGDDEGPVGFFVVLRDLTEQRRIEHFLRQSQRLETVAGLSAGIAHEINNPLAFIRSNLNHIVELSRGIEDQFRELDADKVDECQELRAVAEECCEGADRIGSIVDRMRRFARLNADELTLLNIDHPIRDAVKMARLRDDASVSLVYTCGPGLPPVRASHEHLVQLLLNLLSNARQAVETIPNPRIEVVASHCDGDVLVCVSDNGPGIPTRLRERIFDPFFTTKAPGEGTGLGLSIAFGIARELGGSLEIAADEGGGASFTLRLPCTVESDQAPKTR